MRRMARLTAGLAVGVLLGGLGIVQAEQASALPPATPNFSGVPLEGYDTTPPPDNCDTARPGVVAFKDLVLAAYRSTSSSGITRACGSGIHSDHHAGRAWDWHVSSTSQAAIAQEMITWLTATVNGATDMRVRRMGIRYIIWNNRIWQTRTRRWSTYTYPGKSAPCPTQGTVTQCHRDHMHFSFGTRGAEKQSSWWTRTATPTPPVPPAPAPVVPPQQQSTFRADIDGNGQEDAVAVYDYGGDSTGIWVWYSHGTTTELRREWASDEGAWVADRSKFFAGDFNSDGRTDIGALYDYGGSTTGLWTWLSTGTGFAQPHRVWMSNAGSWSAPRSTPIAGDFTGDGLVDVGVEYDYGSRQTGLYVFPSRGADFGPAARWWLSAAGAYDATLSKPLAEDFDGDGRTDFGAFYDYGGATTGIWTWRSTGTGLAAPVRTWISNTGAYDAKRSSPVTGDFDGDGRADLATFYDYGNRTLGIWTWRSTGPAFAAPARVYIGAAGAWSWPNSHHSASDVNGDGKTDLLSLYDYDSSTAGLWTWTSTGSTFTPNRTWLSNPGSWEYSLSHLF
jgi:hypothetical protein